MSAVPAVQRPAFTSLQSRPSRIRRVAENGWRSGDASGSGVNGNVVSIDEARHRLRGDALDRAVARHPAGRDSAGQRVGATFGAGVAAKVGVEPSSARSIRAIATRISIWVAATVLVLTAALGVGIVLRPASYSGPTWAHSVVAGESVWSVAAALQSSRALEDVVTDIFELNDLVDGTIHPGQELLVPAE